LFVGAGGVIGQYDGTGLPESANGAAANTIMRGASTYAASVGAVCLNGGAVASAAMTNGYPSAATAGIVLFSVPGAVSESLTGYMRRVRYWPRVLSNAELQQVTT
jgi:stage V sporulation protein SpoVS